MTRLKPLVLALSVSLTLAACQKADEPAATAAAPEAPKLQIDLAQVQQQPISLKALTSQNEQIVNVPSSPSRPSSVSSTL